MSLRLLYWVGQTFLSAHDEIQIRRVFPGGAGKRSGLPAVFSPRPTHIRCRPLIASARMFRFAYSIFDPAGSPRASRVTLTFGNRAATSF